MFSMLLLLVASWPEAEPEAVPEAVPAPRLEAAPRLIAAAEPIYPEAARAAGRSGEVVLRIVIAADGSVDRVDIVSVPGGDHGILDEAALSLGDAAIGAATNFVFSPASFCVSEPGADGRVADRCGQHHPVVIDYRMHFALAAPGASEDGDERDEVAVEPSEQAAPQTVVRRHRPLRAVAPIAPPPMQATTTLTSEALQEVRGRSLTATLTEVPGVTMVQAGPRVAKPVVRGQFGRRLLTLVDGVRHEGQDWGIDHAPEIDPFSAGSISVIRGAAGVRYGPDAVAGVVLIEPRPLRDTPGVDGALDLIGVDNGLVGIGAARIDAAPGWLPGLSVRIEGNGAKGAAVASPTYVLGNTASQAWSLGATAGFTTRFAGGAATTKASFRHVQQDDGVCFCLKVNTPADLEALVSSTRPVGADAWTTSYDIDRPRQSVAHDTAMARSAVHLASIGTVAATYAFQLDLRDEFDQVRRSITGPQFSFNLRTHSIDLVFDHAKLKAGRFTLGGTAGLHGDLQEHAYRGLPLIPNFRRFSGGVFAVETLDIQSSGAGRVTLELGARADQMAQTAFLTPNAFAAQLRRGRLREDACAVNDDSARCDNGAQAFTLTGGARTAVDIAGVEDALTLSTEASSATRFPDVDELYLGGRAPSFPVFGLGNAALGSEKTLSASLGARVALPLFVLDVSFFASRTQDYIAFGPELGNDGQPVIDVLITGAYPRFTYSAVDALFSGVDGSVVVAPEGVFSIAGQFAAVQGRNLTTGGALPFVPPPQARVEVQARVPDVAVFRKSAVSAGVLGVMRQTRTDAASDFTPPPPGYHVVDAAARTTLMGGRVQLGLEVKNLLNQRYRDSMSLLRYFADQPGREVWLRISLSLDSDDAGDDGGRAADRADARPPT